MKFASTNYSEKHAVIRAGIFAYSAPPRPRCCRVHADADHHRPFGGWHRNSARTCIFINMNGGPSHLDTFDAKAGPWSPPDLDLMQHPGGLVMSRKFFPKLSTMPQDILALRSCASWEAAHERAQFYIQTAHSQNPALAAEIPHVGAVVAYEKIEGLLPPFMAFNQSSLQGATFLGGNYMPMMPPAARTGIATLTHNFFGTASQQRFEDRFRLLQDLDAPLRDSPYNEVMAAYASYYSKAKNMMYNDAVDATFNLQLDGGIAGADAIGRSLLVARNAIRGKLGVAFVSVTQPGSDAHFAIRQVAGHEHVSAHQRSRSQRGRPREDTALGDLSSTLIVMMGEFGRTPGVLNSRSGRDHYRPVMSVAMIGGGVRGGRVIGASDATGANVTDTGWSGDRAIYPDDIACTIYSAMGIDWTKSIDDTPSGRRFNYINNAGDGGFFKPVAEVFA